MTNHSQPNINPIAQMVGAMEIDSHSTSAQYYPFAGSVLGGPPLPSLEEDMDVDTVPARGVEEYPILNLDVPYEKKWDELMPVLKRLYLDESRKLDFIVQAMKDVYGFYAVESQYKTQFRKWKWKKNVPKAKKEAMINILQNRANAGVETTFKYRGKEVDPSKLRRQAKAGIRQGLSRATEMQLLSVHLDIQNLVGNALVFGNTVFLAWNLPYRSMRSAGLRGLQLTSNSPKAQSTPSDVSILTPSPRTIMPPQNAPPAINALSPMSQARSAKQTLEKTNLFITGQNVALAKTLDRAENRTLADWKYQYWFFAFKSAKHWGRGPKEWTVDMLSLDFEKMQIQPTTPGPYTPGSPFDIPTAGSAATPRDGYQISAKTALSMQPPTVCRWTVHLDDDAVDFEDYEDDSDSDGDEGEEQINSHERRWHTWSRSHTKVPFEDRIRRGLRENIFTGPNGRSVPLNLQKVSDASENSKCRFLQESLGFAIIGRNEILVRRLCAKLWLELRVANAQFTDFFPLHLAASYIDGSRECCNILNNVASDGGRWGPHIYRNHLDHTVLDTLMMRILGSHSLLAPGSIDEALRGEKRFPGEEVDICGRWDADADLYRLLIAAGIPNIPQKWKHKFCNTSIQAICHGIQVLAKRNRFFIEGVSGLFIYRCTDCGIKMELSPIHALMVVCFNLAVHGHAEEGLFGIVAVLLCLLSNGANVLERIQVSPVQLFDLNRDSADDMSTCLHDEMSPVELLSTVPAELMQHWSPSKIRGWSIVTKILVLAEISERDSPEESRFYENEMDLMCCCECDNMGELFLNYDGNLSMLWRAIQTELLTYRRQTEADPWLSTRLDLDSIERTLLLPGRLEIGTLTDKDLMRDPCTNCGNFTIRDGTFFPRASEVSKWYFSNLGDNWQMMMPIEQPVEY